MNKRHLITRAITLALLVTVMNLTACGYFLYPERRGQTTGRLDAAVILLDAAGLLIGIIPGVVAFAVDLSTGAIYLPKGGKSVIDKHLGEGTVQPEHDPAIDITAIAAKLSRELNHPITPEMIEFYRIAPDARVDLASMELTALN